MSGPPLREVSVISLSRYRLTGSAVSFRAMTMPVVLLFLSLWLCLSLCLSFSFSPGIPRRSSFLPGARRTVLPLRERAPELSLDLDSFYPDQSERLSSSGSSAAADSAGAAVDSATGSSPLDVSLPDMPSLPTLPEDFDVSDVMQFAQPVIEYLSSVPNLFNIAEFGPQIFWLFMIIPKLDSSPVAKFIMGPLTVPLFFSLVHLTIVGVSIVQPEGTAPMLEFADVFNPSGDPQGAMVHMMTYPNFVSEEWSHVLTWDLWVGRWIW